MRGGSALLFGVDHVFARRRLCADRLRMGEARFETFWITQERG